MPVPPAEAGVGGPGPSRQGCDGGAGPELQQSHLLAFQQDRSHGSAVAEVLSGLDPVRRVKQAVGRAGESDWAPIEAAGDEHALAALSDELAALNGQKWLAAPILASGERNEGERTPVLNPADRTDHIGAAIEASEADVEKAIGAVRGRK